MRLFSGLGSRAEQQRELPNDQSPARGDRLKQVDSLREKFPFEHPAWIADRPTMGTHLEATRIAMTRQFARVLGVILARQTPAPEDAKTCVERALERHVPTPDFEKHLHAAVETVTTSLGYDEATKSLYSRMNAAFQDASVYERVETTIALTRETVNKMFESMLRSPTDLRSMMSYSGDQSMSAAFGPQGQVEQVSITMLKGSLSNEFKKALQAAHARYLTEKIQIRVGEVIPLEGRFAVTLSIEDKVFEFRATQADLIEGYTKALIHYGSEIYSQRVRKSDARVEQALRHEQPVLERFGV